MDLKEIIAAITLAWTVSWTVGWSIHLSKNEHMSRELGYVETLYLKNMTEEFPKLYSNWVDSVGTKDSLVAASELKERIGELKKASFYFKLRYPKFHSKLFKYLVDLETNVVESINLVNSVDRTSKKKIIVESDKIVEDIYKQYFKKLPKKMKKLK